MNDSKQVSYWPPGPSQAEVEDVLLTHSLVLRDIYRDQLATTDSPEVRFLLASLGQLLVQGRGAVGLFTDYPGQLARARAARDVEWTAR